MIPSFSVLRTTSMFLSGILLLLLFNVCHGTAPWWESEPRLPSSWSGVMRMKQKHAVDLRNVFETKTRLKADFKEKEDKYRSVLDKYMNHVAEGSHVQIYCETVERDLLEQSLQRKISKHYLPNNVYSTIAHKDEVELFQAFCSRLVYASPERKSHLNLLDDDHHDVSTLSEFNPTDQTHVFSFPSLSVRLHSSEAVNTWNAFLQETLGSDTLNVTIVSEDKVIVTTTSQHVGTVLEFLRHQEEVLWIERVRPMSVRNAYGHSVVQIGAAAEEDPKTPLWDRGINGKGQIVGVGDTGIDWDICFMNDPKFNAVPIDRVDMDHRKIISYHTVTVSGVTTDTKDGVDGHGSHVTGSVAGKILQNSTNFDALKKWDGAAPESKLFFTDLQNTQQGGLSVPHDLNSGYFPDPYNGGARIHSNSWGCGIIFNCVYDCQCFFQFPVGDYDKGDPVPESFCKDNFGTSRCCEMCNTYDTNAAEVDYFAWRNPDMLVLFAAGNDGQVSAAKSVGSPGTCKNCLVVGASHTANANFMDTWEYTDYQEYLDMLGFKDTDECCNYKDPNDPNRTELIHSVCCPEYIKTMYKDKSLYNTKNIAAFSSRGNTADGRIKPDILAPGHVTHSCHSDGDTSTFQCGTESPKLGNAAAVLAMSGTSMATPTAAGAAALVRQYLTDGYYPSGKVNGKDAMTSPSGALMKAIIIQSGERLENSITQRGDGKKIKVGDYPNKYAGWGLMKLDSVLRFEDSNFDLFIAEDTFTKEDKDTRKYCFKTTQDSSSFKVTLSWFDYPGNPTYPEKVLVNDLDLRVHRGLHEKKGNGITDRTNNVEQTLFETVNKGDSLYVMVHAHNVVMFNQSFALVATGNFTTDCNVPSIVLNGGQVAGIVVGCVLGAAIISAAVIGGLWYVRHRRGKFSSEERTSLTG